MEDNSMKKICGALFFGAALFFLIYALTSLANLFEYVSSFSSYYYSSPEGIVVARLVLLTIERLMTAAGCALMGISFIGSKSNLTGIGSILVAGGFALLAIQTLVWMIESFWAAYVADIISYLALLAALVICVMIFFADRKELVSSLKIPLIIAPIFFFFIQMISGGIFAASEFFSYTPWYLLFAFICLCGALVLLPMVLEEADGTEAQREINISSQGHDLTGTNGFLKVWVLIVLDIVTLGIYGYIWIYRTVGFLNSKSSEQQGQAAQLLLCLFVPFYTIYWVYKQSKRLNEYTISTGGQSSDMALVNLLLTVFGFFIIAIALIQDQINKNLDAERFGRPSYAYADAYAKAYTTEQTASAAPKQPTTVASEQPAPVASEQPTPVAPMFCDQCGTKLNSEAKFCHKCGAPVRK